MIIGKISVPKTLSTKVSGTRTRQRVEPTVMSGVPTRDMTRVRTGERGERVGQGVMSERPLVLGSRRFCALTPVELTLNSLVSIQ